jgi:deazaflavin-dependent oxidoreductase (nitroreductase family)
VWRKLWRAVGAWPGFTPIARSLVGIDRWLGRLTRGRVVAIGMAPSLYVQDGADLIVIASNWGGQSDPAWAYNLRSDPSARVTLGGREVPVTAREIEGADRERLWKLIVDQWPGYEAYRTRAPHRKLRIFRLTPTPARAE